MRVSIKVIVAITTISLQVQVSVIQEEHCLGSPPRELMIRKLRIM